MPVFDRKKSPPDARDYKLVKYMDLTQPLPTTKVEWRDLTILDQGPYGHCVGFGCAAFGNTAPIEDTLDNGQGHALYYKAKEFDGEPMQENGSTVRSGAQALQFYKYIDTYAFTTSLDEMKRWILTTGPLIVGTVWLSNMMSPDSNGVITGKGNVLGGHCYLLLGYDPATNFFKFVNSWGMSFADHGFFYMDADDWFKNVFCYVLYGQQDGEACAAVETGSGEVIPEVVPPPSGNGCLPSALAQLLMFLGRGTSQPYQPKEN